MLNEEGGRMLDHTPTPPADTDNPVKAPQSLGTPPRFSPVPAARHSGRMATQQMMVVVSSYGPQARHYGGEDRAFFLKTLDRFHDLCTWPP